MHDEQPPPAAALICAGAARDGAPAALLETAQEIAGLAREAEHSIQQVWQLAQMEDVSSDLLSAAINAELLLQCLSSVVQKRLLPQLTAASVPQTTAVNDQHDQHERSAS